MLLGEYNNKLDDKGRVSVPAKFRDDLGHSFIVTKGLDNCLFAYSKEEWATFEAKLKNIVGVIETGLFIGYNVEIIS